MTTEDANRLPEIIDYLRENPTPSATTGPGGQHVHIHHHYAPPAPPPPPPRATLAEQLPAWMMLATVLMITGTVCALVLAVVGIILVGVLLGVAVVVALLAYLVRSMNEGRAVQALAQDRGRKTSDRTRSRRPH